MFVSAHRRERSSGSDALVACSALKHLYRQILLHGSSALTSSSCPHQSISPHTSPDVFFLYLHGDYDFIYQRMVARKGHYMKADLLRSQFDILEPPSDEENVLSLDIRKDMADLVLEVEKHLLSLKWSSGRCSQRRQLFEVCWIVSHLIYAQSDTAFHHPVSLQCLENISVKAGVVFSLQLYIHFSRSTVLYVNFKHPYSLNALLLNQYFKVSNHFFLIMVIFKRFTN